MRAIGRSGVGKPGEFYTTPSASGPGTPDPTWITLTYASAGHSAALAQDFDGYAFIWGGVSAPALVAPSIQDQISTVQEQPFHPVGSVRGQPLAATPVPP